MHFAKLPHNPRAAHANQVVEEATNRAVRGWDGLLGRLHLGGRAAEYDDLHYEFIGGPSDTMRKKHYDKSLHLLWKAEQMLPWSTFHDATDDERALMTMAETAMRDDERAQRERISSAEFRALLNREYTPPQKRAIVAILSAIGHGEAYAWLVSASMLPEVKSTGAKAAVTMQVMEEAKHFVVLRELVQAFDVEVPRLRVWEYLILEASLKAKGLDRFFGMNVLIETIALSIFGLLADKPGLEVLRLFHLDESRHTALPTNYLKEFPLSRWDRVNPIRRMRRLNMVLPALPFVMSMEPELCELGIEPFDFAGSVMRKVMTLADRAGFDLPSSSESLARFFNEVFNSYCRATRTGHVWKDFMRAETTRGAETAAVERGIFGTA